MYGGEGDEGLGSQNVFSLPMVVHLGLCYQKAFSSANDI